jgi:Glycine zipper 2TM domain
MTCQALPIAAIAMAIALAATVAGCASQSPAAVPAAPAPVPRPSPTVYVYPMRGQSAAVQDQDQYECYLWARRQTGFDPSLPRSDSVAPVRVVASPPPGAGVATGAATGAVIGAAVSQPWDTAEGAAVGAIAGAMVGAIADSGRQQQAERIESQENAERARVAAQADAAVLDYRAAIASCLSARGYAVR